MTLHGLGLKSLQPSENVTLDIRDLRERQVPDAQGHTLPPQASRGQVNWSMRGLLAATIGILTVHGALIAQEAQPRLITLTAILEGFHGINLEGVS